MAQNQKQRQRIFYGWWIVIGGATIGAFDSALLFQSFGVYIAQMERTLGWSRTVLSGAYSMSQTQTGFMAPFGGWLTDRIGPRWTIRIGTLLLAFGFIGFSLVNNVVAYYTVFFVMAVGATLMAQVTVITTVGRWFVRNRTKAMAFTISGTAIGGFVGIPIVALGLEAYGWRTVAVISGFIVLFLGLAIAQVFRYAPEEYGLRPDGDAAPPDEGLSAAEKAPQGTRRDRLDLPGFTLREAVRTHAFWIIGTAQFTALLAVSLITTHFILFLKDVYGLSTTQAASILSISLFAQFVFQILGGFVTDKVSKRFVAAGAMAVTSAGLVILSASPPMALVILVAVLHGGAAGFRYPAIESMKAEYFGRKRLGTILGWSNVFSSAGITVGALAGAIVFDVTGTYQVAFWSIAVLAFLGFIGFMLARPPGVPSAAVSELG